MSGSGARSRLPIPILVIAGLSTFIAVAVSLWSILLQLRNYRKPALQRMVVRIMVMVPLYAIASLISIFSVEAAFFIDAVRDIYEAFVIYCFFSLLLSYLGGERSLLIMLHGRPPKEPVFPINLFKREIDVSDPYTFLFLKRGILQYVQVKPVLAAATLILKATGKYNEGDFTANSGYLYVSIIYNVSICLSLYCLAMFWVCVNDDLKPFRPMPKFLCVKGILFFSFWQSIGISVLVAAGIITRLGPYTDHENVSVGLNDILICLEMPIFAFAHMYAFSYKDYIDIHHSFVARMPMYYAFRDSFGLKDLAEDTKTTLRGEGMDYREFEPAEGFMHQGVGRENRIRAGLRYSKGGQKKYWLPKTNEDSQPPGKAARYANAAIKRIAGEDQAESIHAPLLQQEAESVVHLAPDLQDSDEEQTIWGNGDGDVDDGFGLPFGDLDDDDEELFDHSKKYLFGDYNYPVIDCSSESARTFIWQEEERVLRDERGAWFSPIRGAKGQEALKKRVGPAWEGYGAVSHSNTKPIAGPSSRYRDEENEIEYHHDPRAKIIDHEADRVAKAEQSSDVIMRWTKSKQRPSPAQSAHSSGSNVNVNIRSPAPSKVSKSRQTKRIDTSSRPVSSSGQSSASGSASQSPNTRFLSPPSISRHNSRKSSPVLPPDAVDLVVEDPHAEEEEQTWERKKGEPSARGSGLRKVYRRGFVAHLEDGKDEPEERGEVEVQESRLEDSGDPSRRVEAGERIVHIIGDEEDNSASSGVDEDLSVHQRRQPSSGTHDPWRQQEVQGVIATSGTPPLHARVQTYQYNVPDSDNPWA
ncbi:hypothetical protein CVT24_000966 [Panaeolus cyanescens]|uniref:DUF300-domain-containing protein n=1 Tax=Panaeolus cyanescens TaxID=181874 RepID=A0A409YCD8_9AGAR|nr:hypothetical protein CVT24_000966 [Panaeolus cyanescens]